MLKPANQLLTRDNKINIHFVNRMPCSVKSQSPTSLQSRKNWLRIFIIRLRRLTSSALCKSDQDHQKKWLTKAWLDGIASTTRRTTSTNSIRPSSCLLQITQLSLSRQTSTPSARISSSSSNLSRCCLRSYNLSLPSFPASFPASLHWRLAFIC